MPVELGCLQTCMPPKRAKTARKRLSMTHWSHPPGSCIRFSSVRRLMDGIKRPAAFMALHGASDAPWQVPQAAARHGPGQQRYSRTVCPAEMHRCGRPSPGGYQDAGAVRGWMRPATGIRAWSQAAEQIEQCGARRKDAQVRRAQVQEGVSCCLSLSAVEKRRQMGIDRRSSRTVTKGNSGSGKWHCVCLT